jgi:serine/threonine-protein kinase HipA
MLRTLDVYLYRHLVGCLIQDEHGHMVFDYAESWLGDPDAVPLSQSLPLRHERYSRDECRGFFAGILPEEDKRTIIARNLGISAANDFAMLEQIGGECAGAVTFVAAGARLPDRDDRYRPLTRQELADILRALPRRPLMAGDDDVRLSLAGVQDKVAVHISGGQVSIPLGGAPSTHILKPSIGHLEGVIFNEALCMRLAHAVGLPTANVGIDNVEGIDYLLVERYDRIARRDGASRDGQMLRLHQEDFCQALGIPPRNKYQSDGGPSLKQCFGLLRDASSVPVIDLRSLLDGIIFNYLIGNNDAHGKNFSLLYQGESRLDRETRLAPFYDLLSTTYYSELSKKMAMKIGGEYVASKIYPRHFERLADETVLASTMVMQRVRELAEMVKSKLPEVAIGNSIAQGVAKHIEDNCNRAIRNFGNGR